EAWGRVATGGPRQRGRGGGGGEPRGARPRGPRRGARALRGGGPRSGERGETSLLCRAHGRRDGRRPGDLSPQRQSALDLRPGVALSAAWRRGRLKTFRFLALSFRLRRTDL